MKTQLGILTLILLTSASVQARPAIQGPAAAANPKKVSPNKGTKSRDHLLQAYQREFRYLEAEKSALQKRLLEIRAGQAEALAKDQAALASLESDLISASLAADRAEKRLEGAERGADAAEREREGLSSIALQAKALLEKAGVNASFDPDDKALRPEAIVAGMHQVLGLIGQQTQLKKKRGEFFDAAGNKVEGEILQVGGIASYGLSPSTTGALAPAGSGAMRIWPDSEQAGPAALAKGDSPAHLGLFIFESPEKIVEPRAEKTILGIVESGGAIAWVIVVLGALALLMVIARALLLLRATLSSSTLLNEVRLMLNDGELGAAHAACDLSPTAMGTVLKEVVWHHRLDPEERENRTEAAILSSFSHLERFGTMTAALAAVAPLLGLLGTVTGMIATFDAITEFGTGDPKLLAGGISEALITTELGLVVAIPTLLLGTALSSLAERAKGRLEWGALVVGNLLDDQGRGPDGPHDGTDDESGDSHISPLRRVG